MAKKTTKKTGKKASTRAAEPVQEQLPQAKKAGKKASSKAQDAPQAKKARKKAGKKASKKASKKEKASAKGAEPGTTREVDETTTNKTRQVKITRTRGPGGTVIVRETVETETRSLSPAGIATVAVIGGAVVAAGAAWYIKSRRKSAPSQIEPDDVPKSPMGAPTKSLSLPAAKKIGNIPLEYTRIYQLFNKFFAGSENFWANLADSESGHNFFAANPKGQILSEKGVSRQMQAATYGDPWDGGCVTGAEYASIPFTAYLQPDEAKQLPAFGIFQFVGGTAGQAGRRCGRAILAPLPVSQWWEPAYQLAAAAELFGALYRHYKADTPEKMRIAWGLPSKANQPSDPYYIDRAKRWADRQQRTGAPISKFGEVSLFAYSVEDVINYFRQYDYSEFTKGRTLASNGLQARSGVAFMTMPPRAPFTRAGLERQLAALEDNAEYVGSDFDA